MLELGRDELGNTVVYVEDGDAVTIVEGGRVVVEESVASLPRWAQLALKGYLFPLRYGAFAP